MIQKIAMITALLITPSVNAATQMTFGRYQSRAIYTPAAQSTCPQPIAIMVPGSGLHGPEEMMPGSYTTDGQNHSLFNEFAQGLNKGGVATFAAGKPGVEFFKSFDPQDKFYDSGLAANLGWNDLLQNVEDAVAHVKTLPCVDPKTIYLLGHSEGTQVVVDVAGRLNKANPGTIKGLILIGYAGENLKTTVDWQFFRRPIDAWLAVDADTDHDGFISQAEAAIWPEFQWPATPAWTKISFDEIEAALRKNPEAIAAASKLESAKIWQGVYDRAPIYQETAALKSEIFAFNGEFDVQTRPEDALKLKQECQRTGKADCVVEIVPGLGHGMSAPRAPRKQRLLDATLGAVDPIFVDRLYKLGLDISSRP